MYDLYGRKIEFVQYNSPRLATARTKRRGKNKEGACADATDIIQTVKVFMVLGYGSDFQTSQPFADCAVEKGGILIPLAAAYFPESYYTKRWAPYGWQPRDGVRADHAGRRRVHRQAPVEPQREVGA